jgi:serine/threonine protein kinase
MNVLLVEYLLLSFDGGRKDLNFSDQMAKGNTKQFSILSSRQIIDTRLYDDALLETKYEILNKLGEGSFGTVYRVRNKETDLFYAMKTIPKKVKFNLSCFFLFEFDFRREVNLKHQVLIMKLFY